MTAPERPQKGVSYWEYLRVDELLALQGGVEKDESRISNHEVLFIVVHQVFELWFKLVLREMTAVRDLLGAKSVPEQSLSGAVAGLRRVQVAIFDGESFVSQRGGKMPHGRQEHQRPRLRRPDVPRFLRDLGHQNAIDRRIEPVERRRVAV